MIIRREEQGDHRKVEELTRNAFWNLYAPGADEHFIIHELRARPEFIHELSLVAEVGEEIIGHICYSLSAVQDSDVSHQVLTFGPVSVLPSEQGKGIGTEIIKFSIEKARSLGFTAIVIQGYPSYYKRFGFENGINFGVSDMDGNFPKALQVLELQPGAMSGMHGKYIVSSAFETETSALREFDRSFPERDMFRTVSQAAFDVMRSLRNDDPDPENIERLSVCCDRLVDETSALP